MTNNEFGKWKDNFILVRNLKPVRWFNFESGQHRIQPNNKETYSKKRYVMDTFVKVCLGSLLFVSKNFERFILEFLFERKEMVNGGAESKCDGSYSTHCLTDGMDRILNELTNQNIWISLVNDIIGRFSRLGWVKSIH